MTIEEKVTEEYRVVLRDWMTAENGPHAEKLAEVWGMWTDLYIGERLLIE